MNFLALGSSVCYNGMGMYALFYEYPTKRLVTSMRKFMLILTTILCLFVLTSALAECETVVMDSICATVEIPDKYITITPANMSLHPEWLARMAPTKRI